MQLLQTRYPEQAEVACVFSRSFQHWQHARRRGAWRTDGRYRAADCCGSESKPGNKECAWKVDASHARPSGCRCCGIRTDGAFCKHTADGAVLRARRARGRRHMCADDACFPSCGEYGQIDLDISDVFKLELVALPAGAARVLDEDRSSLRRNTKRGFGSGAHWLPTRSAKRPSDVK